MNLSSVVSSRCLGHAELEFGLGQSLKRGVGCEPHHPRKIPQRLDAFLSHNSLLLSSWLLTFTRCKLWKTAIVPSCLDKPASGSGMKDLPISYPFLKHVFGLGQGRVGAKGLHTTSIFSSVPQLTVLSAWRGVLLLTFLIAGCGWSQSQISPQFVALLAHLHLKIHMRCGSVSRLTPVFIGVVLKVGQYVAVPKPLLYLTARPSLFRGKWPLIDSFQLMSCSCWHSGCCACRAFPGVGELVRSGCFA